MRNMGLTIKTVTGTGNYASIETNLKHILDAIVRYNIQIPDINTNELTNIINLTNLTNLTEKLKKWVSLVSLVSLEGDGSNQNEKNSNWDYFKVVDDFDFYSNSDKKYRFKKGQVIKFSVIKAGEYISKGLIKPACPNGHWDPNSRECISDMGGNNNE